ncbi:hypothetical protein DM02DRAFT_615229 [Periconia macrospinosa]|uniref:Zn(2)-C6 fungal-type domain-containing protein n=1 Tax=Periconia macrospinosa TaxID=97972 RepID=A0A2V1DMW4_9PLEO|nr:hypothetical protein DM02DRAFT_615229 [Periconia macrospinosa]
MNGSSDTTSTRKKRKTREDRKPSCSECRAHKVRCDASLDYSRPCSRCRAKNVACIVEEERKKESAKLTQKQSTAPIVNPSGTQTQTIGGVLVEGAMIDLCFVRFYRFHAPLVPILESEITPQDCLLESPFKFWVITAIGSRKCLEDPTLFTRLSPHVESMAMTLTSWSQTSPYPVLEAWLLMCNFQLSIDVPFWRTVYCTLSSAAVAFAERTVMLTSLHSQGVFMQFKGLDTDRGAILSAHTNALHQSLMGLHGYPVNDTIEMQQLLTNQSRRKYLPGWIFLQSRAMAIVAKIHRLTSELTLGGALHNQSRVLRSLVRASELELSELSLQTKPEDFGPLSPFDVAVARLQVNSLLFLMSQKDLDHTDRSRLSNSAIETMEAISGLERTHSISLACPHSIFQGIQLAACTLLRLVKSSTSDSNHAGDDQKDAIFAAINITKCISVRNNDIPAKFSEIVSQLWSSENMYRDASGMYPTDLYIKNHYSMNVVFDCLWWWRKLFLQGPSHNPPSIINNHRSDSSRSSNPGAHETADLNQNFWMDRGTWGFDWDMFDNFDLLDLPAIDIAPE